MDPTFIGMLSGAIMLLSLPLNFYVMFDKLDAAEHYLQRSTYIVGTQHTLRRLHFEGRHVRLYVVATVILLPKLFQWRNLIVTEDIEKIPRRLRCWMVIPALITHLSALTMFISWLLIKA